jgi:hypothetical protein
MAAYPAPATKNRLTMPTGAPAPAPTFDMAADAYPQGTTSVAPKANALASAPMSSPFAPPKGQPRNALLASAFDGFQRGFDPAGFEKRQATNKADGMDKAKQTLALIQQQRALPAEQRAAWWKQNADTIGGIINQDVSSMPIDEAQFTDQALDGHAAALSAQLGIAPEKPEAARYQGMGLGDGGVGVLNQSTGQMEVLREPGAPKPVQSDYVQTQIGNEIYFVNKNNPDDKKLVGPAPPKGSGGSDGEPTAYQLWQMERAEKADAGKAETQAGIDRIAVMGLRDGQERVKKLIGHAGFKGIYGPFGAMGINMGAKPTNLMNQDELNAMALLDQIGGEAFLTGIQKMRGTGPVSENEGKRVAAAVTSLLNRMQSPAAAEAAATEFMASMAALEQAYMKESGGAAMPTGMGMDDVESSGIFDDVMEGAANMFGGVADMFTGGGRMKPGTVDVDEDTGERYRFKGGDPRDQKNWEPVR